MITKVIITVYFALSSLCTFEPHYNTLQKIRIRGLKFCPKSERKQLAGMKFNITYLGPGLLTIKKKHKVRI